MLVCRPKLDLIVLQMADPMRIVLKEVMLVDKKFLELLVCPVSKAPLEYNRERQELVCRASKLAYPIRDGIPVMLESEARAVSEQELGRG